MWEAKTAENIISRLEAIYRARTTQPKVRTTYVSCAAQPSLNLRRIPPCTCLGRLVYCRNSIHDPKIGRDGHLGRRDYGYVIAVSNPVEHARPSRPAMYAQRKVRARVVSLCDLRLSSEVNSVTCMLASFMIRMLLVRVRLNALYSLYISVFNSLSRRCPDSSSRYFSSPTESSSLQVVAMQ